MAYLFDDASSQRITKSAVTGMTGISLWFYPDDSTVDATLYSESNALRTRYIRLYILGASSDKVTFETAGTGAPVGATSTGTVNYNTWNHVYASRGVVASNRAYITLNGETLVDGGAGSYTAPGTMTVSNIGSFGTANFMSGRIAEVGMWNNCLNDFDDRYTALSKGFDPRLIAQDPGGSFGLGALNLLRYFPLIGNANDLVVGEAWTLVNAPTPIDHCRVHRNLMAA